MMKWQICFRHWTTFWLCVAACTMAATAWAFTINGDQDAGSGGQLSGTGAETNVCAGGDGSPGNPYRYEWSGSPSTNLALGGSKIYTSNGKSFNLDLLKDSVEGNVTGTVNNATTALSTETTTDVAPGSITLTNVGNVAVGKINTRLYNTGTAASVGGSVIIGSPGNRVNTVQVAGFVTAGGGWNTSAVSRHSGGVTIYASGAVAIKDADGTRRDVDTSVAGRGNGGAIIIDHGGNLLAGQINSMAYTASARTGKGGDVQLAGDGAGSLDVSAIVTYSYPNPGGPNATNGGNVTIKGYALVTVAGMIDTHCGNYALPGSKGGDVTIGEAANRVGPVTVGGIKTTIASASSSPPCTSGVVRIYSSGDVLIRDSGGVLQSILTKSLEFGRNSTGPVTIEHAGNLQVDNIDTALTNTYNDAAVSQAGAVLCDGNGGGSFEANGISTYAYASGGSTYAHNGGSITIRNYTSVKITNITTYCSGAGTGSGGAISITNITGDIAIRGTIDATGVTGTNGILTLTTTGTGSRITLASLDCSRVKGRFQAADGVSYVTGAVDNFNTTNSTTQTALDAGVGQRIYYKYKAGVLNDYLGGWTYGLPSGGLLKKEPAGTVVKFY